MIMMMIADGGDVGGGEGGVGAEFGDEWRQQCVRCGERADKMKGGGAAVGGRERGSG